MPNGSASTLVFLGIPSLAAGIVGLLAVAVFVAERALGAAFGSAMRRAALSALVAAVWAGATLWLAARGVLARFDARPPPLMLLLVLTLGGAIALACSRFGERLALGLPLWAVVGFQAFRLPLELVLHQAAADGLMPVEMSFSGYNFDILSGVSALLVGTGLAFGWLGARVALLWNIGGLLLLCNIIGIAVAATPLFQAFGPDHLNVWVTRPPYVLLPTVLVLAALFGHVLTFRKLRALAKLPLTASGTGSADRHRLGTV
ncbi:MAG TPA: hypothetical protein VFK05_38485 [Polyangiaceae bacterium]|nr:hypothetical protein [Polyangiaceae bacterium]